MYLQYIIQFNIISVLISQFITSIRMKYMKISIQSIVLKT